MNLAHLHDGKLNFAPMPSQNGGIYYIVVHHSAGATTARAVHEYHKSLGWAGAGYHFFIEPKTEEKPAKIIKCRPLNAIGAHAYGHNSGTVGICLGGNFSEVNPQAEQIFLLTMLAAQLCIELDIEPSVGIIGHKDLMPTDCPARAYDLLPIVRTAAGALIKSASVQAILKIDGADELADLAGEGENPIKEILSAREYIYNEMKGG